MKKNLALFFALIGWFAVIAQFVLMLENRVTSIPEAMIRFFSFFTILTNTLVALYFTSIFSMKNQESKTINKPGVLTALTIYSIIVGLVYQIALRHIWEPQGLQMVVDELLHSVMPILVIIFWSMYETTKSINYSHILKWAIYPLAYLVYILVRGSFSNFYPYPFIDVSTIGMTNTPLINSAVILFMFSVISALLLFIGKSLLKR